MKLRSIARRIAAITLGWLFGGLSITAAPQDSIAEPVLQQVMGTKVRLQPPENFLPAERFAGFEQASSRASIVVTELPAPIPDIRAGLEDQETMQQRGLTVLEKTSIQLDGKDSLLLKVKQTAQGQDFLKWILVFGNDSETILVTASFPQNDSSHLSEPLKQSLLTTRWDSQQSSPHASRSRFRVEEQGDLKLALEMGGSLLFSKDGTFPSSEIQDPIVVVAPSLSPQLILNPEEFAKQRLMKTDSVKAIAIQSSEPITIDQLKGYVMTATAQDPSSGIPMTVYQVMLFEVDQNYYLLQGLVGTSLAEQYLDLFRKMALSFHRQPGTVNP